MAEFHGDLPFTSDAAEKAVRDAAQRAAQTLDVVDPELLRNTDDVDIWRKAAKEYRDLFRALKPHQLVKEAALRIENAQEREAKTAQALEPVRKLLKTVPSGNWPAGRSYLTYAAIDTDIMQLMCENKMLSWQDALNAKAAFGTAEDVQKIHDAAQLVAGNNVNLNSALVWASKPQLLARGFMYLGNAATAEEILKRGANANYDSNSLFVTVTENGDLDVARAFARRAAVANINIENHMNWAKGNSRPKLYENMRKLYWEYGRYSVTDYDTLVETKQLPEKTSQLHTVFNFAARRVSEIYDYGPQRQSIKTDIAFEDYAEEALYAAHRKLVELGGNPPPYDAAAPAKKTIAKPKLSHLGKPD